MTRRAWLAALVLGTLLWLWLGLGVLIGLVLAPKTASITPYRWLPTGHDVLRPLPARPAPTAIPTASAVPAPTEASGNPSARSTPAPGHAIRGLATWYATGGPGEYAAAGPALRHGDWRGSHVVVCAFPDGQARCLTLALTDFCACRDRHGLPTLLDLSLDAVRALGLDPSRGVYRVQVEVLP